MGRSLLSLTLVACWPVFAFAQPIAGPSPGAEYSAVLSQFADDPVKAVSVLAKWTLGDVERGIVQVPRTATGAILRAGDEPGRRLLKRMALLHIETAFAHYNRHNDAAMDAHLEWSRRVVRHELPWPTVERLRVPAIEPRFHTDWALIVAGFFQLKLAFAEARRFLEEELALHPRHALLLLARGMTEEIAASERAIPRATPPVLSHMLLGRPPQTPRDQINRRSRTALLDAARFYQNAIAADRSLHEAQLRLGRVLFGLEEDEKARLELQRASAQNDDPLHQYLASLFLAAVDERSGRPSEAVQHFKNAIVLFPAAQAPYLGLSQLLARSDPSGAGAVIEQMFSRSVAPTTSEVPDPWWLYDAGFGASLPARLEKLRAEVMAP